MKKTREGLGQGFGFYPPSLLPKGGCPGPALETLVEPGAGLAKGVRLLANDISRFLTLATLLDGTGIPLMSPFESWIHGPGSRWLHETARQEAIHAPLLARFENGSIGQSRCGISGHELANWSARRLFDHR